MRIQKMQVLTGTMLSLLLSALTIYPAIAQTSTTESETTETQTQTTTAQTVRGTIRSITDNSVAIQLADGTTRVITVAPADLQRLNLQTGMQVEATLDSSSVATNLLVLQATTTPATGATTGVGTTGTTNTTTGVGTTGTTDTTTGVGTTGTTDTTTGVGTTGTTDTTTGVGTTGTTDTTQSSEVQSDDTTQTTEAQTSDDVETQAEQNRPVRALW